MNRRRKGPFGEDRFADQRTKTRVVILVAALVIGCSGAMGEELPAASRDTIATGLVFAYGNELHPPYVLAIVGNTVRINGVQVFPVLEESGEAPDLGPKPPPPEPSRSLFALKLELEAQGVPLDEITRRMAAFMEVQEGVDSVKVDCPGVFWVYRTDGTEEAVLTYRTAPPPSMEERCQKEFDKLRHSLESNQILVIASEGTAGLSCPNTREDRERLMAEIDRARKASEDEFRFEYWRGTMLGYRTAREFHRPLRIEEE
jgi:hypothetical protein